ncbi:MAG: histidinol dehydrogenase, partial [Chloroflexi bacterium]|nr:histidinol dehydrogenase [Chloroflexota bacterium]
VMLAKKEVFGYVGIDSLAGPTEAIIIADDSATPALVAADLLAQAEHDVLASAILITTSKQLASKVNKEVEHQLADMDRKSIAEKSLKKSGMIAVVDSMEEAMELTNLYAPEHLSLFVRNPKTYMRKLRNAGAVFLGEGSANVLGDYVAGPSHVLPTGGTARFSSGLRVDDFLKSISVMALDRRTVQKVGPVAARLARAEGLVGHARAAEMRFSSSPRGNSGK